MKRLIEIAAIFICFLLQCTLFQHFAFAGIVPNLMIVITSIFGFMEGRSHGMMVGFICGLLTDVFYGNLLGLNALICLYIGYANGVGNRGFYPDDFKFPLLFISASDFAYLLMVYITGFLFRARFNIGYYFIHLMLPELVYTVAISPLLYLPIRKLLLMTGDLPQEDE